MRKALFLFAAIVALSSPAFGQIVSNGSSGSGGGGTVTSITPGVGLTSSPNPIVGAGTISTTEVLGNSGAAITGTTYTVDLTTNLTTSDLSRDLLFTGSSGSAWTLGAGSNGMGFDVINQGTANITITATGNINGAATLVVQPGLWAHIFYNSTTWQAENVPIGSATQFGALKVDNSTITASSGVISAALPTQSNWVVNNWYPVSRGTVSAGAAVGATTTYWQARFFDRALTISQVHIRVSTTSAAQNAAVAIYAADASTGLPTGSAICNINTLSTTTATDVSGNCSAAVTANKYYWFGYQVSDGTAIVISLANGNINESNFTIGTSGANVSANTTSATMAYTTTGGTFGTWPTTPTITQTAVSTALVPFINFKVGSIP